MNAYLARVGVALLVVGLLASYLGSSHFMLDNLSSFRMHFAIAFLLALILTLVLRERGLAVAATLGLTVSLMSTVPWYQTMHRSGCQDKGEGIGVMFANVSMHNSEPKLLSKIVKQEQPDIIGLAEYTVQFAPGIDDIRIHYPYRLELPEKGPWGAAIFSKNPLREVSELRFNEDFPATLHAIIDFDKQPVNIVLVHPQAPTSARSALRRDQHLRELADTIRLFEGPMIILGDFNLALWSQTYEEFVKRTGLLNARQGFGVAGTWPPSRLLGVPIDHILHSGEFYTNEFRVLRRIGSDHLPIAATLAMEQPMTCP